MPAESTEILVVNGGSSSIKFAVFRSIQSLDKILSGQIKQIGKVESNFKVDAHDQALCFSRSISAPDFSTAILRMLDWIETYPEQKNFKAIGHRLVTGGDSYFKPTQVNETLLKRLNQYSLYDPDHLPFEIQLVRAFLKRFPGLPQFACFDTEFHHELPFVAKALPIPRQYLNKGIRRFGFHGLSYQYLIDQLSRQGVSMPEKVVLAHLGSGASLAAVFRGKSIDTSMGLTPASGVMMGTRSGDLDPGLGLYLATTEQMLPESFNKLVNFESGLLGISETSSDMESLLEIENQDSRAKEAIDLFCYQVKKCIGSYAAALGGIDTLVFSGGIGEKSQAVRTRICSGLEFLGIDLEQSYNAANLDLISKQRSRVQVRIIPTDEEIVIARALEELIKNKKPEEAIS